MSGSLTKVVVKPLGDSALMIQLGDELTPAVHHKVQSLSTLLETNPFDGFVESVPAFTNITIYYNPVVVHRSNTNHFRQCGSPLTPLQKVKSIISEIVQQLDENYVFEDRLVEIPVLYGGEYGPDLYDVAAYHNLSAEEVIEIHTKNECLVYMLGFAPGFPFMGGMDERIATPRKDSPRLEIPPGSVGIAGKQTGIYPLETPGGWQIIGRTPLDLFQPDMTPPTLLKAGDRIKFYPISLEEYKRYKELNR